VTSRYGIDSAVFSLKCYAAAMLSVYLALSIGLDRPYWAFLTAYIVSQPLAGAVLSKALFRIVGTFTGAVVAVAMVPVLVQSPELMTLGIASWLALCVFVSLLDRTPRSYMFVLSGYTALLIALPTFDHPQVIFTVASLRVQEILLGILCGSLVHAVVLPESVSSFLLARVSGILRDAERWSRDSLASHPDPAVAAERQRLALDVTELHQLSIHLPYETSHLVPRVRTVRALQDQLSLLLPLGAGVADRLVALRETGRPLDPAITDLLGRTCEWLGRMNQPREERDVGAQALIARCAALEPDVGPESNWRTLITLSLLARLGALIAAHRDCRDLADQMTTRDRRPVTPRVAELLEERRNRELHLDAGGALRGAISAFLTMVVGSTLWIASGWSDGASAVMLAGVFLSLFAASPDPVIPLRAFFWGTLIATILGAIYGFAILPRLDGFPEFAAAYAPPLLVLGAMMHSPRLSGIALPTLLGMGSPLLISSRYQSDFTAFINGSLAQLIGVYFAIIMVGLLQSAGVETAIRRTLRAGWRDIAERSNLASPPDLRGWINRMLDRIAVLAPRLALSAREPAVTIDRALRDLRTGIGIGELRQLRIDLPPGDAPLAGMLGIVLSGVGDYYAGLDPDKPPRAPDPLRDVIDRGLPQILASDDPQVRRTGTLGLVTLRRMLFPAASDAGMPKAFA
jgi:uncharacterized membrane protein YccC